MKNRIIYYFALFFFGFLLSCKEPVIPITTDMFPNRKDTIVTPVIPDKPENPSTDSIYQNFLTGEVKPGSTPGCFAGAYYRKLVSSDDSWLGISGKVILPAIEFDLTRVNPAKPGQYLDNPSIYMGGRADGQETDIGLTWEVVMTENGGISTDRRAFRPFYRWAGHSSTGQVAGYGNAPVVEKHYFYPGDTVYMSVQLISDKTLRFIVEGNGKKFQKDVVCNGYTFFTRGEYKRVNAIDQVSNEGKPVQQTNTKVLGAKWIETNLYRNVNGKISLIPFNAKRQIDMRCPNASNFSIYSSTELASKGGEQISIFGGNK
ncbi:MAG: hypothetical protein Q7U47_09880 [Paludibacter sp.]|nr:hypothetical protein [Paludibacter sp.]